MDIDAEPANDKHPEANREEVEKLNNRAFFQPVTIQSAAVLEAVKARPGNVEVCLYGGATADLDSFCARRRPKSTVGAKESLRRGRTKESAEARKKAPAEIGLDSAPLIYRCTASAQLPATSCLGASRTPAASARGGSRHAGVRETYTNCDIG